MYSNYTSYKLPEHSPLINSQTLYVFQWICFGVICQIIGLFGTVTNIINIMCFVKQGFKDPINVSLLGLAVSNSGCLLTLIWLSIGVTPAFEEADLPFSAVDIDYLTGGWPHVAFTRISSCITAFITLERCLCVALPLKVKLIITPRRRGIIVVSIFTVLIASVSPMYCVNKLALKFFPERNTTMLGLVYTEDRDHVERVSFAINNIFVPFVAFMVIFISTVTLVIQLKKKMKWRRKTAFAGHSVTSSANDQVAKMVVIIASLFIICFTPICAIFVGMILEPKLAIDGEYRNLFLVISGLCFILESTNSSVNIFIYYRISTKYRAVFHRLFGIRTG